jgi:hypothetical protein
MTDRHETITVTLDKRYRIDDLERTLIPAIEQFEMVAGVEPGSVNQLEKHTVKMQLEGDLHRAITKVFESGSGGNEDDE